MSFVPVPLPFECVQCQKPITAEDFPNCVEIREVDKTRGRYVVLGPLHAGCAKIAAQRLKNAGTP